MAQGARRRTTYAWLLAAALLWPAMLTAQVLMNLAGEWGSNINVTYTITQAGSQFVWQDSSGVRGSITVTPSGLHTVWSDATGTHSATGTIVATDAQGQPTRIQWSNGVVFERRQAAVVQAPATLQQVSPAAVTAATAAPPPAQTLLSGGGTSCAPPPGPSQIVAGDAPVPPGGLRLTLTIPEITGTMPGGGVVLRGATFASVRPGAQGAASGGSASATRADVSPMVVRKLIDASSPGFLQMHLVGKLLAQATIAAYDTLGRGQALWILDSVLVASHRLSLEASAATAEAHTEEIQLTFQRLTLRVYRYDAKGAVTCTQTRYDLTDNKPF